MNKLCTACGYVGRSRRVTKGSIFIELFLWLLIIVPGLIYSIWRLTSKFDACPKCNNAGMIPADSPIAKKFRAENNV